MKIFFQFKKKKERKGGGENGGTNRGEKTGIRISFVSSSRSSFSLFLSPPILETNSEFLKVETFALAGAQLLKLSITGPPTPSPSSSLLLTRGRHRYKTAFASLSNPRSYSLSPFLLILYAIFHLPLSRRATRTCTLGPSSIVIQFTEVESPPVD